MPALVQDRRGRDQLPGGPGVSRAGAVYAAEPDNGGDPHACRDRDTVLGVWLVRRVRADWFYTFIFVLMITVGAQLLWKALSA